jgi:hypothetical protein
MIFVTIESPVPALREPSGVQTIMIDGVAKPGARFGLMHCAPQ